MGEGEDRRWAFSLSNAGARYAEFRADLNQLSEVDWVAVANHDFRSEQVKEGKQAEFLVQESLPLELVTRIGVCSEAVRARVSEALGEAQPRAQAVIRRDWYF